MSDKPYEPPTVKTVGTVAELTAGFNKNGPTADSLDPTAIIVGSNVTPAP